MVEGGGVAEQDITRHLADQRFAQKRVALAARPALPADQKLRHVDLHDAAGLFFRRAELLVGAVIALKNVAVALGRELPGNGDDVLRPDVAHDAKHHVFRVVERLVAGVERLGSDFRNALDRTGDGDARGGGAVQALEQPFIDLPVGRIFDHADLLSDDAALLLHAFVRKVRDGNEGEQEAEVFLKMLGAVEIIGGHGVAGKGVRLRAVLTQFKQRVAVLGVEHLVLKIVCDAGRGIVPRAAPVELHVHAAVAGGKKRVLLAVTGLRDDTDAKSVWQRVLQNGFTDARIIQFKHPCVPPLRSENIRCREQWFLRRH